MFGTAKEISAELFREYHYDEPLAVLIWDTQSLWYALAKYTPPIWMCWPSSSPLAAWRLMTINAAVSARVISRR